MYDDPAPLLTLEFVFVLPLLLSTFLKLLYPVFFPELFVFFPELFADFPELLNGERLFAEGIAEFMAETVAARVDVAAEFTAPKAEFTAVESVLFTDVVALFKLFNADVASVVVDLPILLVLNIELILCIIKITNPRL